MNVRHWSKTERDSLEHAVALMEEGKPDAALPIFENILNHHSAEDFLKYAYARCALYNPDKQSEGIRRLNEVYEKNRKTPDIQFYMATAAWYNGNFDEALAHITGYLANRKISPQSKIKAEELKKHIAYARYYFTHPGKAKIYNLGSAFNSTLGELSPATDAGATQLIFLTPKSQPQISTNNVMLSNRRDGELDPPVGLNELGEADVKHISLSHDGMCALLSIKQPDGSGDIYISRFDGNKFGAPEKLKGNINSSSDESGAALSATGQELYFSSNRPGGRGSYDLYVARRLSDSSWSAIKNLGDSVNTALDETSPFLHADGKTLFFSSAGHNSMGGLDVCKAQFRASDSTFHKAQNLGYPINSPHNDFGFVIAANAENAYYASNRKDTRGRSDIYHCELNLKGLKPSLCLLKGKIFRNNAPCTATIEVQQLGKNPVFAGQFISNPTTGDYLVALPTGSEYQLSFSLKNYNTKITIVDLVDMVGFIEKTKNMNFDALFDSIKPPVKPLPTRTLQPITVAATITASAAHSQLAEDTRIAVQTNNQAATDKASVPEKKDTLLTSKNKPDETRVTQKNSSTQVGVDTAMNKMSLPPVTLTQNKPDSLIVTAPSTPILASGSASAAIAATTLAMAGLKSDTIATQKTNSEPAIEKTKTNTVLPQSTQETNLTATKGAETPSIQTNKKQLVVEKNIEPVEKINWNNDAFEPATAAQEKMMANAYRYGNIGFDSLEFRVQISAFKNNMHYYFPKLEKFGKIEKVELGDGYKRLILGGSFKTYGRAFAYAKKIIKAGHDDVFIVVIYKGYRYSVEDLEEIGVFK